jgi:hypothetical protein
VACRWLRPTGLGWFACASVSLAQLHQLDRANRILGIAMPRYVIERNFAEQLEASKQANDLINRVNDEEGVKWLFSFLSADRKKTYCLYEAPNEEAIRVAARRAGLPADVIVEVSQEIRPDMFD